MLLQHQYHPNESAAFLFFVLFSKILSNTKISLWAVIITAEHELAGSISMQTAT